MSRYVNTPSRRETPDPFTIRSAGGLQPRRQLTPAAAPFAVRKALDMGGTNGTPALEPAPADEASEPAAEPDVPATPTLLFTADVEWTK